MRTAPLDEHTQLTHAPVAEKASGGVRDPFFDNAKFLAMVLVVVGHLIEPLRDVDAARGLYVTIYAFHMPVFILVAGYLSRSFTNKPRQAQRALSGIVLPYIVFEVSYEVILDLVRGDDLVINLLSPSFAMWFLIALLVWRLSTPLWNALHPAIAVGLAVLISLLAGMTELPDTLNLSRVLGFLPFYVLGLMLPAGYFELVRRKAVRIAAVPTLLGAFAGAYFLVPDSARLWLYYDEGYHELGTSVLSGALHRGAVLVVGFALLTAFLALVPRVTTWFTSLGAATMYVYLLHRFPRKGASSAGLYDLPWLHTLGGVAAVIAIALALTLLLSSRPVVTVFRPVVEPKLDWLFRLRRQSTSR